MKNPYTTVLIALEKIKMVFSESPDSFIGRIISIQAKVDAVESMSIYHTQVDCALEQTVKQLEARIVTLERDNQELIKEISRLKEEDEQIYGYTNFNL